MGVRRLVNRDRSALFAGFLVEGTTIRTTLVIMAAAYVVVSVSAVFNPAFRQIDVAGDA